MCVCVCAFGWRFGWGGVGVFFFLRKIRYDFNGKFRCCVCVCLSECACVSAVLKLLFVTKFGFIGWVEVGFGGGGSGVGLGAIQWVELLLSLIIVNTRRRRGWFHSHTVVVFRFVCAGTCIFGPHKQMQNYILLPLCVRVCACPCVRVSVEGRAGRVGGGGVGMRQILQSNTTELCCVRACANVVRFFFLYSRVRVVPYIHVKNPATKPLELVCAT